MTGTVAADAASTAPVLPNASSTASTKVSHNFFLLIFLLLSRSPGILYIQAEKPCLFSRKVHRKHIVYHGIGNIAERLRIYRRRLHVFT